MEWETDQPPINYLKRRIVYYKKKRGHTRNLINSQLLIKKYGKLKLFFLIASSVDSIEKRIKEFEKAIKKLESK